MGTLMRSTTRTSRSCHSDAARGRARVVARARKSCARERAPMATDERPCEERPNDPRAPLLVGSDCSGMCTESHAPDALGIAHAHAFSSEVWEPAIRCVRAMGKRPKVMY